MDGLKRRIGDAMDSQSQSTVTVLSTLLAVQDELGFLPKEAIEDIAVFNGSTINDVWAVASFYPNFRFEPPCLHQVEVCWGASCHLVGAMPVIEAALEASGLETEGDTLDGRLTLHFNTCLGACAQAPVMAVDHHLIGRVTPDSVRARIAVLQLDANG